MKAYKAVHNAGKKYGFIHILKKIKSFYLKCY